MVLDSQQVEIVVAPGVEDEVVAADRFAQGGLGTKALPKSGFQLGGFTGGRSAAEEVGSEFWIAFEGGDGLFEEVVEQRRKGPRCIGFEQELLDGVEIISEVAGNPDEGFSHSLRP